MRKQGLVIRRIRMEGTSLITKGSAVRRLKRYVSWVQTGVSQVGPYLSWV
jgi:hypothetical protein